MMDKMISDSACVSKDWSLKEAVCKGVAFRNAQKRMDLDSLTNKEQLAYFQRRKFAVPMYIVSNRTDFSSFVEVSKKVYERLALPEQVVPWTKGMRYRLDCPFAWINGAYSAVSCWPYGKDDFAGALTSFANDAKKMSVYILHYAGYLHTGNWHWRKKVVVQKSEFGVTVKVSLEDPATSEKECFVFEFGCVKTSVAYSNCHLRSVLHEKGNKTDSVLDPGFHTVVFDQLRMEPNCEDAVTLCF